MKDLLQELWDEYRVLCKAIDTATDDVEIDENVQSLIDAIGDTKKMAKLRTGLYKAGVKNIPGIDYSL